MKLKSVIDFLYLMYEYKYTCILSTIFLFISIIIEPVIMPWLIGIALEFTRNYGPTSLLYRPIIGTKITVLVAYVLLWFITIFFEYISYNIANSMIAKVEFSIKNILHSTIREYTYDFYQKYSPGLLQNQINNTAEGAYKLYNLIFSKVLGNGLIIICLFGVIFFNSVKIGLLLIIYFCLYIILFLFFEKKIYQLTKQKQSLDNQISDFMVNSFHNQLIVSLYKLQSAEHTQLLNLAKQEYNVHNKTLSYILNTILTLDTFCLVSITCINIICFIDFYNGKISIGALWPLLNNIYHVSSYIGKILDEIFHLIQYISSINMTLKMLNSDSQIIGADIDSIKTLEIQINQVWYNIDTGVTVLDGPTGCGKTSILNELVNEIYEKKNVVKVNGILNFNNTIKKHVTYVPQEQYLFHNNTIYYNIVLNNEISSELFQELTEAFNVDEFVQNLSNKYQTKLIGSNIPLSGGQKQRISILRAVIDCLINNKKIILFDEPYSACDDNTAQKIHSAILKYCSKKIVILVDHSKLSHLTADKIITFT